MPEDTAYASMRAKEFDESDGDDNDDDDSGGEFEPEEAGTCKWKIGLSESTYDLSMVRMLQLTKTYQKHGCAMTGWGMSKVMLLLLFNAILQMMVVFRVNTLIGRTREERQSSVFAPGGNCHDYPPELFSENPVGADVGKSSRNWDCGPLWPMLMSNVTLLDVNKDGYWDKMDGLTETSEAYAKRFDKHGDLPDIFQEFMEHAKKAGFQHQIKHSINPSGSDMQTTGFTRIPMKWMVDEQPLIELCNNVNPDLCGNLEVRGILKARMSESTPGRRVRKCVKTYDWCYEMFGEHLRAYTQTSRATCDSASPVWETSSNVILVRYERADKYNPRLSDSAILSQTYETFLMLVLIIWWLTVIGEARQVLHWFMVITCIPSSGTGLKETILEDPVTSIQTLKITVTSIQMFDKVFILGAVLLPRALIIAALAYVGTDFLIIADNYGDLILNSVALSFLIEVDDMLFAGLASSADRFSISNTEDIEAEHQCNEICVHVTSHETTILLLLFVILVTGSMMSHAYTMPFGKIDLMEAYECLCHLEGKDCIGAQVLGGLPHVPSNLLG